MMRGFYSPKAEMQYYAAKGSHSTRLGEDAVGAKSFKAGQWVIYRKPKTSVSPGFRAKNIHPAPQGETYSYLVDKFWVVQEVLDDGRLRLRTRRGKEHLVAADDRKLRRANWWERCLFRRRFLAVEESLPDFSNVP